MPGLSKSVPTSKWQGQNALHLFNTTIAATPVTRITGTLFRKEPGSRSPPFSSPPNPFDLSSDFSMQRDY